MKKIHEEIVYKGWRGIIQKRFELLDGTTADFDIVDNGSYISVAAFTAKQEVILVRQFRPGPEKMMVSFCEGYIDTGETPEQSARRELLEETGYQVGEIHFLRRMHQAYSTETKHCFIATNCRQVAAQQLDATENIDVFTVSLASFRAYLIDSSIDGFANTGLGYMALDFLQKLNF